LRSLWARSRPGRLLIGASSSMILSLGRRSRRFMCSNLERWSRLLMLLRRGSVLSSTSPVMIIRNNARRSAQRRRSALNNATRSAPK
jgi:hypothetical protein